MKNGFINKYFLLKEIPLFTGLSEREREYIDKKTSLVEYRKNQVIYAEGTQPSGFYCIIFGRVVVFTGDKKGSEKILEYLSRGKYFGIISLLTGDPHSVTARAVNDCLILYMPKEAFMSTLKKIPRLAIDMSQTLSRRLKRKDLHQKIIFETTIISVSSVSAKANKALYAANLALSIRKETGKSVAVLEAVPQSAPFLVPAELSPGTAVKEFNLSYSFKQIGNLARFILKERTGIDLLCLRYNPKDEYHLRKIVNLLGLLVNDYHFIILALPSFKEKFIFDILNQSNLIHIFSGSKPADFRRADRLRTRLKDELQFPSAKIRLIVEGEKPPRGTVEEDNKSVNDISAFLPALRPRISRRPVIDNADCEYARRIRRIARNDGDCMVGLALGVGFAYGFCHVGVFKVLEDEKIPIDVISGSSMGALLASLWATGRSSREIIEITRVFKEPKYIWSLVDLTFPFVGFIKGNKLYDFLKRCLGSKTFADTRVPIKIIASDVKRKEWRILDRGLLIDAIMASCAMPGVFMPYKFREEMLFDGGVIMPMPTEPLVEMGVRKIIAVNVTPSREDVIRQFKQMKENAAGTEKLPAAEGKLFRKDAWYDLLFRFSLKNYVKDRLKTNILDIIFSSFEIMQSEMVNKEAQFADVVLHPDVGGLHWMELNKAEEFVKRGEVEAKKHLERMRALIKE
ncbi:MAG: cyclic nucleotide-binding domain-containing protein [Candidatus Omnitrophica bacterium]|nr:cyclic nucleotide-binding domain-containing protein [Candidatus Omnitrophota bacterium]